MVEMNEKNFMCEQQNVRKVRTRTWTITRELVCHTIAGKKSFNAKSSRGRIVQLPIRRTRQLDMEEKEKLTLQNAFFYRNTSSHRENWHPA